VVLRALDARSMSVAEERERAGESRRGLAFDAADVTGVDMPGGFADGSGGGGGGAAATAAAAATTTTEGAGPGARALAPLQAALSASPTTSSYKGASPPDARRKGAGAMGA